MFSCFCILRSTITPSWMAPLALLLLFSSYQLVVGFGFSSFLFTSLAVFLSIVLFMWKQHKAVPVDKLFEVEENALSISEERSDEREENIAPTPMHKTEEAKEIQQEQVSVSDDDDDDASSLDKLSESECQEMLLSTSEDYGVDHTPECSDGSISDEDSLIEIALPSGHFVDQQKEEVKKKRELTAEALFNQQSLMEFLAEFNEMNEEENLIEIDISMGSIKYSRFEIEPQTVLKV
ncbi:hypothetical protein VNO77_42746 [Canavalia gladiata]|uniref:Uncharacterized protein n=1 Tax=Canavalia gladiata TaxID=3824 RepID=A0AAN9JSW8_CANGL